MCYCAIVCVTAQALQQLNRPQQWPEGKEVEGRQAALRQIRSIRRSVSRSVLLSLVTSLVLSRLHYGSSTLAGLHGYLVDRLQSVLNAAARLIHSARKYDPVTPLLQDLHWLRMPQRIEYRLAVLSSRLGATVPRRATSPCR